MIVVDASALMAIVLDEPQAAACMDVLEAEDHILISAGTVAEALISAGNRNVGEEMSALIDGLGLTIAPVSAADARRVADVHAQFELAPGAAGLTFGGCCSYSLAQEHGCALLYAGDGFDRIDPQRAA